MFPGMSEQQSFQSQQNFSQESSSQQVYEATEQSSHMRGYQAKGEDVTGRRSASANAARESGIFGGIGGDDNSFVENEFDYKKHTVKDLAQHFAHVKPKTQLPSNILPEQKMYNGQQVPGLNYLGGQQDFSSQKQVFTKKEVSAEDIEASKQAYEMKKKQQMEKMQQTSTTSTSSSSSTTTSQQSTVVMREKKTEETRVEQNDKRRASLSSALLMDPATAHAQAGIIDPSAILRGETLRPWAMAPTTPTAGRRPMSLITQSTTPKQPGFRPFGSAGTNSPMSIQPPATNPISNLAQTLPNPVPKNSCPVIIESAEVKSPSPLAKHFKADMTPNSAPVMRSATLPVIQMSPSPTTTNEYQATVQTTTKLFSTPLPPTSNLTQSNLENISPNIQTTNPTQPGHTNAPSGQKLTQSVIHTMLQHGTGPNCDSPAPEELGLTFPRSTCATPAPTQPFPPVDSLHTHTALTNATQSDSIRIIPPSPTPSMGMRTPSMGRRTPILVTTRPSSVTLDHRTRHVSKDDLARMMAELNAPLPPMIEIPDEIRASPLIFSHGGLAAVPYPTLTKTSSLSSQSSTSSLAVTTSASTHPTLK